MQSIDQSPDPAPEGELLRARLKQSGLRLSDEQLAGLEQGWLLLQPLLEQVRNHAGASMDVPGRESP